MSFYRNTYLRSEHWGNLRAARLAKQKGRCAVCQKEGGFSLDVHHIQYRNLYDVHTRDLRGVCRNCHEIVHAVIESTPQLKTFKESGKRWWWTIRIAKSRAKWARRVGSEASGTAAYLWGFFLRYNKIRVRFCEFRRMVKAELDPTLRSEEMPWYPEHIEWMTRRCHRNMTALGFYRVWLEETGGVTYQQRGEH